MVNSALVLELLGEPGRIRPVFDTILIALNILIAICMGRRLVLYTPRNALLRHLQHLESLAAIFDDISIFFLS